MKCNCKNVDIGTYANQVNIISWWSNKIISVDTCLKDEILNLWENKITTTGCCCGHNKLKPMINVAKKYHKNMIKLGYNFWVNEYNVHCYEPKTI
jgi:hypothetical protein